MPFVIRKLKFFLKILKIHVWPPLPGVWKFAKTHYKPKNENHRMGVFDSSNEALWCTDYNAKNPSSLRSPIPEKIKKNGPKLPFFQKLPFFAVFLDFFRNWTSQRAGVFCVVISAPKRFIWAIKHLHTMIFIFRLIMGFCEFSDPW